MLRSPNKCASRSPRWPNTSAVASSTSTPSSASMASAARPPPHPPGPPSTCSPPPSAAPLDRPPAPIAQATGSVHVKTLAAPGPPPKTLVWGREHDTRPITATGELNDGKVAAYVAKYATKAAECTGTLDQRINPSTRLADLPIREHPRRLI